MYADRYFLAFLAVAMVATYFVLLVLFPFFFGQKASRVRTQEALFSSFIILALSTASFFVGYAIPDLELGNRFVHVLGGGFLAFLVCFLAAKNSEVCITRFQFFFLSALLVLALGMANELLEFALQEFFGIISSTTTTDTWLDLLSNTVGIAIAAILFVPLYKNCALDDR